MLAYSSTGRTNASYHAFSLKLGDLIFRLRKLIILQAVLQTPVILESQRRSEVILTTRDLASVSVLSVRP